jgi:Asp-tRNA(Asn)/Glu-tRNA(Gln) amidotransferase A subunit family amidase
MSYTRREFNRMSLLAAGASLASATGLAQQSNVTDLYNNADATALAEYVRKGEVSALELLEEAIRRTELVNPVINAVSQKHYELARDAIVAGLPQGPFTGVPFLLKDLKVSLAGTVTSNGSRLHGNNVAKKTSLLVQRYQQAGLVIYGKTNTPEYGAALTTENLFLGDCLNPWNTQYSTGGSSGGSAAAVAANILPMAHATDGGGSIRVPADHCGVFGFKPTRGVTPGASGSAMSVSHVVARSVRDSAAMLDATAGYEPGAPYGLMCEPGGYLAATRRETGKLRVALNLTAPAVAIDPDCKAAVLQTARLLEQMGHHVEEATPALDYKRLNEVQNILIANGLAAHLEHMEKARGKPIDVPDIEPMTRMIRQAGSQFSQFDYVTALQEMHGIGRAMGRFMADYDVILQPVTATPAPKLKTITYREGDTLETYTRRFKQVSAFTHLYNMSGQPSMSLPLAFSGNDLPIGVMLSGRVGEDALLFSLAAQLERTAAWQRRLPPINADTYTGA